MAVTLVICQITWHKQLKQVLLPAEVNQGGSVSVTGVWGSWLHWVYHQEEQSNGDTQSASSSSRRQDPSLGQDATRLRAVLPSTQTNQASPSMAQPRLLDDSRSRQTDPS